MEEKEIQKMMVIMYIYEEEDTGKETQGNVTEKISMLVSNRFISC